MWCTGDEIRTRKMKREGSPEKINPSSDNMGRGALIWKSQDDIAGKISENIEFRDQLHVRVALKTMRKACVKKNKNQKELSKYAMRSQRESGPNIPYKEKRPIEIKEMNDLIKDAKLNYSLKLDKKKFEAASMLLGKPRSIFPELVSEIKIKEEERIEEEELSKIEELNGQIQSKYKKTEISPKKEIERSLTPISTHKTITRHRTLSPISPKIGLNCSKSVSEESGDSFDSNLIQSKPFTSTKTLRMGTSSASINLDDKIHKIQERKKLLLEERERDLMRRMSVRMEQKDIRLAHQQLSEQQKLLLVSLTLIGFISPLVHKLSTRRREIYEIQHASVTKKAALVISNWWWGARCLLKLKRNPNFKFVLRLFARRSWARNRLYYRKHASELIKTFIKDSTGLSETMRKIYAFRAKILKIQRFIREYIKIQQARIQILWMITDNKVKSRLELERIAKFKKEQLALKAMAKMQGFGNALIEINTVKKSLDKLLNQQTKAMKRIYASQALEDQESAKYASEVAREAELASSTHHRPNSSHNATKSSFNDTMDTEKGTTGNKKKNPNWWKRVALHPANKNKLLLMQQILRNERKRFIDSRLEKKVVSNVTETKLDISDARVMLLNTANDEPIRMESGKSKTDKSSKVMKSSKSKKSNKSDIKSMKGKLVKSDSNIVGINTVGVVTDVDKLPKQVKDPFLCYTKGGIAAIDLLLEGGNSKWR